MHLRGSARSLTLFVALVFTVVSPARATHGQQPQADCPTVRTSGSDLVTAGQPVTFVLTVNGGDPNVTPTYNWMVSAGSIESGQGTSTITVSTAEISEDSTVTATVELGGYD